MKTIVAIGGSNSVKSINKMLAVYAAGKVEDAETVVVDLNDYILPMFGVDEESANGMPADALKLNDLLSSSDGVVVSLAEHNGSFSAAFKNMIDWLSRINREIWKNKPMLLMASSPGPGGANRVLESAKMIFPTLGGNIVADLSFPSFHDNFSEIGVVDQELNAQLNQCIKQLQESI
jgi:chromate reductase